MSAIIRGLMLLTLVFYAFGASTMMPQVKLEAGENQKSTEAPKGQDCPDVQLAAGHLLILMEDIIKDPQLPREFYEKIIKYRYIITSTIGTTTARPENETVEPTESSINCHIEFTVLQRHPGRCTRLSRGVPACRSKDYIAINYHECS